MEYSALARRWLLAAIASLVCAGLAGLPGVYAQTADSEPYFALSSDKTFKSDQKPVIHVFATNVTALEFRVYRVNDPLEFFKGLEDLHNFGGQARQMPRDLTLIERFHQLKRDLRFRIRNTFRAQYTDGSRAAIRDRMERRATPKPANGKAAPSVGTVIETYPEVPLLNPQQVV